VLRLNLREESEEGNTEVRKIAASVFLKNQLAVSGADKKKLEKSILKRLNALIPFSESKIQALPFSDHKENQLPTDETIFSQSNKGGEIRGKRRELTKGAAIYYQDKENKNVTILESDRGNTLGWGSDFIVGTRLAEMIDQSK